MSQALTVARPYARAAFQLAQAHGLDAAARERLRAHYLAD